MFKKVLVAAVLAAASLSASAGVATSVAASSTFAASLDGVAVSTDTARSSALSLDVNARRLDVDVSYTRTSNDAASFTLGTAITGAHGVAAAFSYVH